MRLSLLVAVFAGAIVPASVAMAADMPAGVAACSGCHAVSRTVDTPVPRLLGRKAEDISFAMREYKAGTRPATVMGRLAKGFSDDEIAAMASWFAGQKD